MIRGEPYFCQFACCTPVAQGGGREFVMKSLMYRKIAQLTTMDSRGQGLVEYALIIALIAIVVITVLELTGTRVTAIFQAIADQLEMT